MIRTVYTRKGNTSLWQPDTMSTLEIYCTCLMQILSTLKYVQFPDTVYIHWYTICIILHVYGYTLPPSSCIECLRICLVSWASRTKHLVFTYTELQNLLLFKYYQFDILILNWWALNCYLVCGYESLHASAPCSYVRCPTPADVTWHNAPDWLEHADR